MNREFFRKKKFFIEQFLLHKNSTELLVKMNIGYRQILKRLIIFTNLNFLFLKLRKKLQNVL